MTLFNKCYRLKVRMYYTLRYQSIRKIFLWHYSRNMTQKLIMHIKIYKTWVASFSTMSPRFNSWAQYSQARNNIMQVPCWLLEYSVTIITTWLGRSTTALHPNLKKESSKFSESSCKFWKLIYFFLTFTSDVYFTLKTKNPPCMNFLGLPLS